MKDVWRLYETVADEWARDRQGLIGEESYLDRIASKLAPDARVLDLGCGTGDPIARFFIERGFDVTGVDAAPSMVAICRTNFPEARWVVADMRTLMLEEKFDVIVAWDSFFHLPRNDQRAMFAVFRQHAAPKGLLLFTSGVDDGEVTGSIYGRDLFHASLSTPEYRNLLGEHGFDVLSHTVEDLKCGRHTVWLAQRRGRMR